MKEKYSSLEQQVALAMLDMPKEIAAQFAAVAQARGMPLSDYVRDFIVEHYEGEADDLRTA